MITKNGQIKKKFIVKWFNYCIFKYWAMIEKENSYISKITCLLSEEPEVYESIIDKNINNVIRKYNKSIIYFYNFSKFGLTFY